MAGIVQVRGAHPNIVEAVERMLIDIKYKMPFYGEFNLMVNFKDGTNRGINTISGNMTRRGMFIYFNNEFFNLLGTVDGTIPGNSKEEIEVNKWEKQKMVNFIILHQDFHFLFNHPQRTVSGRFNRHLASVAQDMIINSTIHDDIDNNFVTIPTYPDTETNREKNVVGKNMTLFVPKQYHDDRDGDEPIFEDLYNWLREKQEDFDKRKEEGNIDPSYGANGVQGDMFNLDHIFDNLEENQGEYLDSYLEDEIPDELRDSMVRDVVERMRGRGLVQGNIEQTINKLRKKRKDYLREIKRSVSNEIMGNKKQRSITRPNRRGIKGIKGNRKVKSRINVILDTSGSMMGMFERVLEYVFQNDVEINMAQVDTVVHEVKTIKSMRELEKMDIKGLGGTILQPAIDLISQSKEFNQFNTVLLTDGYCDTLDLSRMQGRVLGVTCGTEIPVSKKPLAGYREIMVEKTR